MATFFQRLFSAIFFLIKHKRLLLAAIILIPLIVLAIGKTYQRWDDDPDRGAIAIKEGAFGESYPIPVYLEQGWSEADSLWFYNTTQGSALLPYDFFVVLEQQNSTDLFRSAKNIDLYRYLPQKSTFFNPDGFPVGFTKDSYQGRDYVGYTCAACHTGQINYTNQEGNTTAIRIDGGPAMADMVSFLAALEKSMAATLNDTDKRQRFIDNVIALNNDYDKSDDIVTDLEHWTKTRRLYNTINHSHIKYGYARLDAFGRIYNRVLQHMINKPQLANAMQLATSPTGNRILTDTQIKNVLVDVGENIIVDKQFTLILERLVSKDPGYPGLNQRNVLRVFKQIFNEADAPVSYPFLWDIAQSDYVQWNGVASNAAVGPLGRNTGEVIGVFAILDWTSHKKDGFFDFSLSAKITGQDKKDERIDFKSSADLLNLGRLENHLKSLKSPLWPEEILGTINTEKAERGQLLYAQYCQSCHEVIDRSNWDRIVIAEMTGLEVIGTDTASAENGVFYKGKSGNLKHTVQGVDVGDLLIKEDAPVLQILTSATKGVIATPDPDKWFIRRWTERIYTLAASFFGNTMPATIKSGNYIADTTSSPYNSLLAYKGRSLNGIWATAPYLHNGSVPTLYDLLLPTEKCKKGPDYGEYRPDEFRVGKREFDPKKVGFLSDGDNGFRFTTHRVGDKNIGHVYGSCETLQLTFKKLSSPDPVPLPPFTPQQRWDLVEYMKTL